MLKLLENERVIHIVAEIIVIIGVSFYFSSKIRKLYKYIEDLSQRLEQQETQFQRHLQIQQEQINALLRKVFPRETSSSAVSQQAVLQGTNGEASVSTLASPLASPSVLNQVPQSILKKREKTSSLQDSSPKKKVQFQSEPKGKEPMQATPPDLGFPTSILSLVTPFMQSASFSMNGSMSNNSDREEPFVEEITEEDEQKEKELDEELEEEISQMIETSQKLD